MNPTSAPAPPLQGRTQILAGRGAASRCFPSRAGEPPSGLFQIGDERDGGQNARMAVEPAPEPAEILPSHAGRPAIPKSLLAKSKAQIGIRRTVRALAVF